MIILSPLLIAYLKSPIYYDVTLTKAFENTLVWATCWGDIGHYRIFVKKEDRYVQNLQLRSTTVKFKIRGLS